ncbi:hypothetical protein AAC387_Pa03g1150 [Persea americana]
MEEGCILVTLVEPSDYGCLALVDILDLKPIVDGNVCLGKVLMENFRDINSMLSLAKHLSLARSHVTFLNSDHNHHCLLRNADLATWAARRARLPLPLPLHLRRPPA